MAAIAIAAVAGVALDPGPPEIAADTRLAAVETRGNTPGSGGEGPDLLAVSTDGAPLERPPNDTDTRVLDDGRFSTGEMAESTLDGEPVALAAPGLNVEVAVGEVPPHLRPRSGGPSVSPVPHLVRFAKDEGFVPTPLVTRFGGRGRPPGRLLLYDPQRDGPRRLWSVAADAEVDFGPTGPPGGTLISSPDGDRLFNQDGDFLRVYLLDGAHADLEYEAVGPAGTANGKWSSVR